MGVSGLWHGTLADIGIALLRLTAELFLPGQV